MHQLHFVFAASLVLAPASAPAQEEYEMAPLPAICTNSAMAAIGAMKRNHRPRHGHANRASAQGARSGWKMRADMSVSVQAPDIDVAFQSQPLHQGTISLARVQLNYGKAPEKNKLAE